MEASDYDILFANSGNICGKKQASMQRNVKEALASVSGNSLSDALTSQLMHTLAS